MNYFLNIILAIILSVLVVPLGLGVVTYRLTIKLLKLIYNLTLSLAVIGASPFLFISGAFFDKPVKRISEEILTVARKLRIE